MNRRMDGWIDGWSLTPKGSAHLVLDNMVNDPAKDEICYNHFANKKTESWEGQRLV